MKSLDVPVGGFSWLLYKAMFKRSLVGILMSIGMPDPMLSAGDVNATSIVAQKA